MGEAVGCDQRVVHIVLDLFDVHRPARLPVLVVIIRELLFRVGAIRVVEEVRPIVSIHGAVRHVLRRQRLAVGADGRVRDGGADDDAVRVPVVRRVRLFGRYVECGCILYVNGEVLVSRDVGVGIPVHVIVVVRVQTGWHREPARLARHDTAGTFRRGADLLIRDDLRVDQIRRLGNLVALMGGDLDDRAELGRQRAGDDFGGHHVIPIHFEVALVGGRYRLRVGDDDLVVHTLVGEHRAPARSSGTDMIRPSLPDFAEDVQRYGDPHITRLTLVLAGTRRNPRAPNVRPVFVLGL